MANQDCDTVFLGLDKNLRWDLFAWLEPLDPNQPKALMVIGAKLKIDIPKEDFCDNIVSTIPGNGFTNAQGKILNKDKRERLLKLLAR